ncbi:hypothetical protein B1H10_06325 [candidate division KSB1 bacterium 4484_188]|nr:MAG: hypothetical protein B1H10_06325 [candidate division KSB1 bacterium 4484_188]
MGIVAVDPTSPFSGGAVLGDRIRMNDLLTDPGIFIRSRQHSGNESRSDGNRRYLRHQQIRPRRRQQNTD